jgi:mannose-6-phosphate isomerase-like protein (cupin superfamily)
MKNTNPHQMTIYLTALLIVLGFYANAQDIVPKDLNTEVFSIEKSTALLEEYGRVNMFMTGDANTYGLKDVSSGILSIFPGNEAHPPHQHVEEEFLLITKGSGTWNINGKEIKAKTGDLLYASPWDMHGIYNSDTTNLEFFFVKWNNKGLPLPEDKKQ